MGRISVLQAVTFGPKSGELLIETHAAKEAKKRFYSVGENS
jgi:hypothetical protein